MKKNHIICVTGQLGGTLFRQEARQQAEKLGLIGIARIQSNGELRIEVEGEEDALDAFQKWCKNGPEGTTVQVLPCRMAFYRITTGLWRCGKKESQPRTETGFC